MQQYLPKRIHSMVRGGDLNKAQLKACALFCYYEHVQWLLFSGVGSNFPRGYKVQTSLKVSGIRAGLSARKPAPEDYRVLRAVLIEELAFHEVANARLATKLPQRTAHRRGKELFRQSLANWAERKSS